jgi:hypothetical protein
MYNDASNPAFVASSSATDLTSGIAKYAWNCAGVTYDAQSTAVMISGPDGPYEISLTVTDRAGNASVNTFPITKATVPPGKPKESLGSSSYGSNSPILEQNPTVTWKWEASSSLGLSPDTFLEKLDTETTWTILPLSTPTRSLSLLPDGTYTLLVMQVDTAGNQSPTLSMPLIVTPVIPVDGSTVTGPTVVLGWRDFTNGEGSDHPDSKYHVHIWSHDYPSNDFGKTVPGNTRQVIYNPMTHGTYYWYVEFDLNGTDYTSRIPSADGTYQFTVQ